MEIDSEKEKKDAVAARVIETEEELELLKHELQALKAVISVSGRGISHIPQVKVVQSCYKFLPVVNCSRIQENLNQESHTLYKAEKNHWLFSKES